MQCYSKARQNNRDPTFIYSFVSNHFLLDLEYIQRLIGNSCGISLFAQLAFKPSQDIQVELILLQSTDWMNTIMIHD